MTNPTNTSTPQFFTGSISSQPQQLPKELVDATDELEKKLAMPVWFLVQSGTKSAIGTMERETSGWFAASIGELPQTPVALVIESPGGNAAAAYQIGRLLQKRCGGFVAVVPRYAKSAATLLSLGADAILLSQTAELGPLDAQIFDPESEEQFSALDEVQALERVLAFTLEALDSTALLLHRRTGKKTDTILPWCNSLVSELVKPLMAGVDVVHYTQMSRSLNVAKDYAIRLMQPRFAEREARSIAQKLVENYADHGFIIDADEARELGLNVPALDGAMETVLQKLGDALGEAAIFGKLVQQSHA